MERLTRLKSLALGLAAGCLALVQSGQAHGQMTGLGQMVVDRFSEATGYEADECPPIVTVNDLARLIDHLDKKLYHYGKIAVMGPSVFGQNRMTGYRQDYEDQMKSQLGNFELILSSYQRRSDAAALTSATSIQAAVQGPAGSGAAATPAASSSSSAVAIPTAAVPFTSLFQNASGLVGTLSPDLTPAGISGVTLSNTGSKAGIGLEPTTALDERSNYLNHLNELRRINAGDDKSDLPGYGLYLVRMPISLLPSRESIKGKGASVTVKAKHNLTADVLPNTFRNVAILDTTYSLMETITRGQFFKIEEPVAYPKPVEIGSGEPAPSGTENPQQFRPQSLVASAVSGAGLPVGATGNAPSTEVIQLFGADNLMTLVSAMHDDQVTWYRHDPSVVSWIMSELGSAYNYMREQAHRNNPMFQPAVFEQVGAMVLQRKYAKLQTYRNQWITNLRISRGVYIPDQTDKDDPGNTVVMDRPEPLDVLAFALIVQSVFLDRQIKYDMEVMAQRKPCACGDPWALTFYDLYPTTPEDLARYAQAQAAFCAYVECKWPIHVFAIDPVANQQNQLDLFSQRTQLQLALAVAVASGQVNFQNATSYARRTELDLASVALNRTAIGFGAGDSTFGWQFYPRIQSPPLQNNLRRVAGILINNGPGPDYTAENLKIEPGQRECYALVVMPNFVPQAKFTSVTNWFDLKTKHAEQVLDTTDMISLGKRLQAAKHGLRHMCDTGKYRPEEVELLADRIGQLEDMLPIKSHSVVLPFEGSLLGSEIFSSNAAGLAPRLLAWYGEPPHEGAASSVFLLGNGFGVHESHVIAGGAPVSEDPSANKVELISRNVLRIEIPATATAVETTLRIPGPDGTRVRRKLIDVHVATPNGVSNHLLVETQAKPASVATTPAPGGAAIQVSYALLRKPDGPIVGFAPVVAGPPVLPQPINLEWPASAGLAPPTANVSITIPNDLAKGSGDLVIPVNGLTKASDGTFPLAGTDLNVFAANLVEQFGNLNLLAPNTATFTLTASKITIASTDPTAKPQDVKLASPLTVSLTSTSPTARISSPFQLDFNQGTLTLPPNSPGVSIDWLGNVPQVQANVVIDFTLGNTPIGSITFSDGPGGDITVSPTGGRTISATAFLAKLNNLPAVAAGLASGKITSGTTLTARSVTLFPTLEGMQLAPVIVNNPFVVNCGTVAKKSSAITRPSPGLTGLLPRFDGDLQKASAVKATPDPAVSPASAFLPSPLPSPAAAPAPAAAPTRKVKPSLLSGRPPLFSRGAR